MDKRETAVVGVLDILGYKEVVKAHIEDFDLILGVENLLKAGAGLLSKKIPMSTPEYQDYRDKIIDLYRARVVFDSVIFTLLLSKITPDHRFEDNDNIANYLWTYFKAISMFCPFFIGKTGHVLRGGISIGPHYENEEGNNLFIFSQAFVDAVELEKNYANYPRILIDSKLTEYLKSISFPYMDEFFYEDGDKRICFDLYSFFKFEERDKKILNHIKEGITLNIKANIQNNKVIDKLKYFVEYHNKKMITAGNAFTNFMLDNSIFKSV